MDRRSRTCAWRCARSTSRSPTPCRPRLARFGLQAQPETLEIAAPRRRDGAGGGGGSRGLRIFVGWTSNGFAGVAGLGVAGVLERLRSVGLDAIAEHAAGSHRRPARGARAGSSRLASRRCASPSRRRRLMSATRLVLRAAELQEEFTCIQSINPLPTTLNAMRPTTGYDDVKSVAIARLAAPNIPTIQVDWLRYGPKLAQVALTFGADDLDNVTAATRRRTDGAGRRSRRCAATSRRQGSSRPSATAASRRSPDDCRIRPRRGRLPQCPSADVGARPLAGALAGALRPAVGLRAPALRWRSRSRARPVDRIPAIRSITGSCPGVGIGSRGPVASVALFTRRPVGEIRHIALDTSSRTSVTLIKVLCHHRFRIAAGVRAARPGPRGHDARLRCGAADRRSGARGGSRGARPSRRSISATSGPR